MATEGDRLDTMHVALVRKVDLAEAGFKMEKAKGRTKIDELLERHVDLVELNSDRLCALATLIATALREKSQYRRYLREQVREIVRQAISDGRIDTDDLHPNFAKHF